MYSIQDHVPRRVFSVVAHLSIFCVYVSQDFDANPSRRARGEVQTPRHCFYRATFHQGDRKGGGVSQTVYMNCRMTGTCVGLSIKHQFEHTL